MYAKVSVLKRIIKLIIRFNPKRIQFFINHIKSFFYEEVVFDCCLVYLDGSVCWC